MCMYVYIYIFTPFESLRLTQILEPLRQWKCQYAVGVPGRAGKLYIFAPSSPGHLHGRLHGQDVTCFFWILFKKAARSMHILLNLANKLTNWVPGSRQLMQRVVMMTVRRVWHFNARLSDVFNSSLYSQYAMSWIGLKAEGWIQKEKQPPQGWYSEYQVVNLNLNLTFLWYL